MNIVWALLIVLLVLAIAGAPAFGPIVNHSWGWGPSSVLLLVLVVLLVLALAGRL